MTLSDRIDIKDPAFVESINALIHKVNGSPDSARGRLVREMIQNCLRIARDEVDLGDVKLMGFAFRELRYALSVFRPFAHVRKITIFGSARTHENEPAYEAASLFSKRVSEQGWMVITGAGDGIMRAGHGGAGREASFGVAIRLPFETNANEFIIGDDKLITHRYFFTRKLMFVSQADAIALFPGGFGTLDEGFEVLTLVQTGKGEVMPIVLVDEPGGTYWRRWEEYVKRELLDKGMIDADDTSLYYITDRIEDAVDHVLQFYRNYHSQRFVDDMFVLRIQNALSDADLAALNSEFADLVVEGRIEQHSGPLEGETEHPELPRLAWHFVRRSFGRLRQMIDRINEMGPGAD